MLKCPVCNGMGEINIDNSNSYPVMKTCPICHGRGEISNGSLGELAQYAREQVKGVLLKELLNQREIIPCLYGGGDVIISFWYLEGSVREVKKVAMCLKARQIKVGGIRRVYNRQKQLLKMGCPEPNHSIFSGWKCKYADGEIHPL